MKQSLFNEAICPVCIYSQLIGRGIQHFSPSHFLIFHKQLFSLHQCLYTLWVQLLGRKRDKKKAACNKSEVLIKSVGIKRGFLLQGSPKTQTGYISMCGCSRFGCIVRNKEGASSGEVILSEVRGRNPSEITTVVYDTHRQTQEFAFTTARGRTVCVFQSKLDQF